MIDLFRRDGRPLSIAHRGAPLVAPENTIASFAAAVALGVDLVELDVLALRPGPLVVAHSDRLDEITHGVHEGRIGERSLEALRELAPEVPTFDEALAWFAEAAPEIGIHVDLKLRTGVAEVAAAIEGHGVAGRTVVSAFHGDVLREVARASSRIRIGFTYPDDRFGISRRQALWPLVSLGLSALRASVPWRVERLLARADATALMLNQALVTSRTVESAHALGVPVLAWTVDRPADVVRVIDAGVDGVITNDPGMLAATLAT